MEQEAFTNYLTDRVENQIDWYETKSAKKRTLGLERRQVNLDN